MSKTKDVIESWFFVKESDATKGNLDNAIGYAKVIDGILKESRGKTESGEGEPNLYAYIASSTKTIE